MVPSRDRPIRLLWLLNALEEQTLDRSRWEVVVGHDSSGPETETLLRDHPLARAGHLRHVSQRPGSVTAAGNRNAAWRLARGRFILFTDDDCRPPAEWLSRALEAALRHPDSIVQGRTEPDPEEWRMTTAPHFLSQYILSPPTGFAETCNIIYPRGLLERVGGFDDALNAGEGEDTDLALRAKRVGAQWVGAPEVVTYHAVHEQTLWQRVRWSFRWRSLPQLVKTHPETRSDFPARYFWKRTHIWLPLAVLGLLLGRKRSALILLAAPWAASGWPDHGKHPRGVLRSLSELPGRLAIDLSEFAAMVWGSIKHRTLLL